MNKLIYITGGARSGKSSLAEKIASDISDKVGYVATGIPFDDEMKERILVHKEQRPNSWTTIEGYKNITLRLSETISDENVIILDCLTIFITNLMLLDRNVDWDSVPLSMFEEIETEIENELLQILFYAKSFDGTFIIVSNEVGMGIVPDNRLSRYFRDIAGRMNKIVAEKSDEAYLMVSGMTLRLK